MTTPSYSSGEANPYFNFEENNFVDNPFTGAEENPNDWNDQLNSSALELQSASPMPRQSPIHEAPGSPTSSRTESLWDERFPLVGMPTNGKVALAAVMLEQNTPEEFNLYGTDQIAAAAPPEVTDQLLFRC